MEWLKVFLAVTLIAGAVSTVNLSQKVYAADASKDNPADIKQESIGRSKIDIDIDAKRDRIIEESKAIKADRRKLKATEKIADKAKAEQIRQEINNDIGKREAAIKELKKDISNKRDQQIRLMYGKGQKTPRLRAGG